MTTTTIARRTSRPLAAAAALAIAVTATATTPSAEAAGNAAAAARYQISYGSVPVGHADTNVLLFADGRYGIGTTFSSGGVAKLLSRTEGQANSRGALAGSTAAPAAFDLAYTSGDKKRSRAVAFAGGTVSGVDVQPARPVANPATPAQLINAIDPASALLVRAPDNGAAVCNRTLPVFDGRARLDLTLTHRATKKFRAKGWRGKVHECEVSLTPIAGVKPRSEKEMRGIRGATVSFAQVPGTDAWMAVELKVPSSIGTVTAKATRLTFAS